MSDQVGTPAADPGEFPETPSWIDEQVDRHGTALAGFRAWLHREGLIATDVHFNPAGAVAGDDDRDIDQLVDAYVATQAPDGEQRRAYGIEHAEELLRYAEALDGWGCLLLDSYRIEAPGDDPVDHLPEITEWYVDIVVGEAEKRAERCCPNC